MERKLTRKGPHDDVDVGKVLGAFVSSAFVHSFAAHTVTGGWTGASGEAWFFLDNGLAIILEEGVKRAIKRQRRKHAMNSAGRNDQVNSEVNLDRWYDGVVGRVWWTAVLLFTGRNFARGWVYAGLVREMAGL